MIQYQITQKDYLAFLADYRNGAYGTQKFGSCFADFCKRLGYECKDVLFQLNNCTDKAAADKIIGKTFRIVK
jgi:hypothetical protein